MKTKENPSDLFPGLLGDENEPVFQLLGLQAGQEDIAFEPDSTPKASMPDTKAKDRASAKTPSKSSSLQTATPEVARQPKSSSLQSRTVGKADTPLPSTQKETLGKVGVDIPSSKKTLGKGKNTIPSSQKAVAEQADGLSSLQSAINRYSQISEHGMSVWVVKDVKRRIDELKYRTGNRISCRAFVNAALEFVLDRFDKDLINACKKG